MNYWTDLSIQFANQRNYLDELFTVYPTEKNIDLLKTIISTSSNENSLVFDCFCGSGGTLVAADELKRRWIGIDNSGVAIKTTLKRLKKNRPSLFTGKHEFLYLRY